MPSENTALKPVPKLENDFYNWYQRHDSKVREAQSCNHEIVFIGDSITHLFEGDPASPGRGEKIWREMFGTGKAMNLGFGWDRTQNALWRLDNGEFANQTPRLAVVLIGTNNLTGTENARTNSPAEIVEGIQAVCSKILSLSPKTHILLMGILPRSSPSDPLPIPFRSPAEKYPGDQFKSWEMGFRKTGFPVPRHRRQIPLPGQVHS